MIKLSLDNFMNKQGLSIQDVAEKTGLSRNTISQHYNNSSKGIQFETLDRLTTAFNIDIYDLFEKKLLVNSFNFTIESLLNEDNEEEYCVNLLDAEKEIIAGFTIQPTKQENFNRTKICFFEENIRGKENFWIINNYLANFSPFATEIGFSKIAASILKQKKYLENDYDVLFLMDEIQSQSINFIRHSTWLMNEEYISDLLKTKYAMNFLDDFNVDEFGDIIS